MSNLFWLTDAQMAGLQRKRRGDKVVFVRMMEGLASEAAALWWKVATRYDRCPKIFLSAVALAATVMFC